MAEIEKFNLILSAFKIKALCVDFNQIDNYLYYDIKLEPKTKVKDISKHSDEIALTMKASGKPIIKILHDKGVVRLEFFCQRNYKSNLFDLFTNINIPKGDLICLLGKNVEGQKVWMDLANNPHMIIAGTTGSGKSTLLHNIIANIINYNDAKIYLLDPKRIEFSKYKKLNINVGYSFEEAVEILETLIQTMETRYEMIRNFHSIDHLPNCVLIIDEFADLIMQDKDEQFYNSLCKLAQKCRVAKINIILSTQRPSVNIVNGAIKANFPARISCKVVNSYDSKVILDSLGAETLHGCGDALIKNNMYNMERFQIAYTNPDEIIKYFGN